MFEDTNPVGYTIGFMSFIFAVVVIAVIIALEVFHSKTIKCDIPIEPEIRLKVKKNQVDTVYVYKEPKWHNQ